MNADARYKTFFTLFLLLSSSYFGRALSSNNMKSRTRIELFFRDTADLKARVGWLTSKGYSAFNLVNKHPEDALLEWKDAILTVNPVADVCLHYSLKYQKVKRGTVAKHKVKLDQFLDQIESISASSSPYTQQPEILMVTGSTRTKGWDTAEALKGLAGQKGRDNLQTFSVAYNPFLPDAEDLQEERRRLNEKVWTKLVSKIYLQFGTDLTRLEQELQHLRASFPSMPLAASIFLPTKQLIAQQKFRPWKGVFLCDQFLSGHEEATKIVVDLIKLYQRYEVELLVEAPGVRKDADLDLYDSLLQQANGGATENGSSSRSSVPKCSVPNASDSSSQIPQSSDHPTRSSKPAIVLFGSHDLRLHDNHALHHALTQHSCIIPVFLWQTPVPRWGCRGALQVVLKDALAHLAGQLDHFGLPLVCRNTLDSVETIAQLVQDFQATAVFYNREHTSESRQFDRKLVDRCLLVPSTDSPQNIKISTHQTSLLYDVEKLELTKGFHGGHWGTLMPFLKGCQRQFGPPPRPIRESETWELLRTAQPAAAAHLNDAMSGVEHLDWDPIPPNTPWDVPILQRFPTTTGVARARLRKFLTQGLDRYERDRSRADLDLATSQLSVHLRLGVLSPREIHWSTQDSPLRPDAKKTFYRRLFWRDLAYFQLYCFPHLRDYSIRSHYEATAWIDNTDEEERRFQAWKQGKTGYPMVDAGMRELYATGWMNQSVRMIAASFLVEYLRINWIRGAAWFHDTLADADSAINPMMWQNAGRSGIDQWNFVLNPTTGSQDATGDYVRGWLPELADLPRAYQHQPWKAPAAVLQDAGVILGRDYPHRIVTDLAFERAQSVENVLQMRRGAQEWNDDRGYDRIRLPNGDTTVVFTKKEYRIDRAGIVRKAEAKKTVGGVRKATKRRKR